MYLFMLALEIYPGPTGGKKNSVSYAEMSASWASMND